MGDARPDLAAYLLERIAERQTEAPFMHCRSCTVLRDWHYRSGLTDKPSPEYDDCDCGEPGRVLAECEAKRRIIGAYGLAGVSWWRYPDASNNGAWIALHVAVTHLAAPYADRDDFRPEWKP